MQNESRRRTVNVIPPDINPLKKVAIYCRVSTTHESQEESLDIQIESLKYVVDGTPGWSLYKVYSDRDSGGNLFRPGFQELIFDCYENLIDIVLVKYISRFARNTVDMLDTVHRLKGLGIEVIFHEEHIRSFEAADAMLLSTLSAIAQAQSESISESIKWGLRRGFISGKSKLYSRKCFGYKHNEKGELVIDEGQAEVARTIFDLYLSGLSIVLIIRELEKRNIKSPKGKDTWSKLAIQSLLTNEKYCGNVLLGKSYASDFPNNKQLKNRGEQEQYLARHAHEPIIGEEMYEQVQAEISLRSNIEIIDGMAKRKGTHYSAKREKID